MAALPSGAARQVGGLNCVGFQGFLSIAGVQALYSCLYLSLSIGRAFNTAYCDACSIGDLHFCCRTNTHNIYFATYYFNKSRGPSPFLFEVNFTIFISLLIDIYYCVKFLYVPLSRFFTLFDKFLYSLGKTTGCKDPLHSVKKIASHQTPWFSGSLPYHATDPSSASTRSPPGLRRCLFPSAC